MRHPATRLVAFALLLCGIWALALAPQAQAQSNAANLQGKIVDGQGGALPGVTITATNKETGLVRVDTTGPDGSFRLPSLPVGTYEVTAELASFATVKVEDVKLTVASNRSVEITMNQATLEEAITVVDEAPLVAGSPTIGADVSQSEIENLPLNGRQFANLATLAPGTTLSINADPTKPGQQTVALNGGVGRNVNYVIDGGDNTDDTIGGALQNFNLEAVQEFKIQTQQYKAEFGRSTGGVLSVVTKTGTNQFAGSVYGFFRDDSLNAKTETEKQAGLDKQPFERKQYGASLGGPIVRDKAHFFATYEKTEKDTLYTVTTGGLFPEFDNKAFATPFEDELGTVKATWDISSKQYLQVRYGFQKNTDKYGASPLAVPSNLGTVANDYSSILAGHTAQLGADALNEFLFQYTKFENTISADSNLPNLLFPNGVASGQNGNTPQSTRQTKKQFKDDFSWSTTIADQRHDLKVGVNYIDEPVLSGDFTTGTTGQFTLLNNDINSPVTNIQVFGGFSGNDTPVKQYSGYVQDDWFVTDRLTINLGLRYDYFDGFDLDQRSNPIWQAVSSDTRFREQYLRDFQGGKGGVLENDDDNFGPRLGFSYDLSGDGKKLLRGGWGIYYDFPYTNATILFPASAVQSNYGVVYSNQNPNGIRNADGSFFRPGQPLPPNQLPGAAVPPPNELASPTLATPKAEQASLGFSWEVNNWLGINAEAINIEYSDIPYRFRANPTVDANGAPTGTVRRFPQFGNFRIWYGDGKAEYKGANLGFRTRSAKFSTQGFYTYSKAEGNVLAGADEFRLTNTNFQPDLGTGNRRDVLVDPLNPNSRAGYGPLNTDARHRVTFGAQYQAPLGINVSGIVRYHSGFPFLVHSGRDLNGDSYNLDLGPGVSRVNSGRGDSFSQVDLRVAKEFTFANRVSVELIGEVFNLFDEKNPAGYIGDRTASNFGQPTTYAGNPLQGEQRLGQLGLRIRL